MSSRNPNTGDSDRPRPERHEEHLAGDFPASRAHHAEPRGAGPTADEQVAQDTELASTERGAHSEEPVGGTIKDDDRP